MEERQKCKCIWPFLFCIRIENFEGAHTGQAFLEISNGRKTVRMAPILMIFGPNESQCCQLNFEKQIWAVEKISARAKNSKKFAKSSKNFALCTVFGTKQNRNDHIFWTSKNFFGRPKHFLDVQKNFLVIWPLIRHKVSLWQ